MTPARHAPCQTHLLTISLYDKGMTSVHAAIP
jgi:hypothetical protein